MTPPAAALALLGLIALTTAAGLLWRARTGRLRPATGRAAAGNAPVSPADLGAPGLGARATLVQFSTALCGRCPATARVLGSAAAGREGVEHLEIDLADRPELARRFGVLQTPTTLLLDGRGRVRGRIAGAARPGEIGAALDRILTE